MTLVCEVYHYHLSFLLKQRRRLWSELASAFDKHIPTDPFSPAEIQGFLLMRTESRSKALQDIVIWADASQTRKKIQSKISVIQ